MLSARLVQFAKLKVQTESSKPESKILLSRKFEPKSSACQHGFFTVQFKLNSQCFAVWAQAACVEAVRPRVQLDLLLQCQTTTPKLSMILHLWLCSVVLPGEAVRWVKAGQVRQGHFLSHCQSHIQKKTTSEVYTKRNFPWTFRTRWLSSGLSAASWRT